MYWVPNLKIKQYTNFQGIESYKALVESLSRYYQPEQLKKCKQ